MSDDSTPNIRLVQFTRAFYLGGTETQVLELLRGLPERRYQVQVGVLEAKGPLMAEVEKLGFAPAAFPLNGSIGQANTAVQIARLAAWLNGSGAQVVHVHDFYATVLAVPAAKLAGCKVIVGRLDLAHWHGRVRRTLLSRLTRAADHVIANAEAVRSMLMREEGLTPEQVTVIPNGLDLPRFDARRAAGLNAPLPETNGDPVIVHVANMNSDVKRQEDLLEAVAQVRKKHPLRAFLVGDGPRRAMLEQKAAALGVGDFVHFLGHRTDVPAIYARATLGVLCSSAEGMSNAIMEGMAAGLPMVVTRAGGNPELIAHQERGLVVEPFQPLALAAAIRTLLASPDRARALGQNGRAFVERELSLSNLVARHDAVYRAVLASRPPVAQAA